MYFSKNSRSVLKRAQWLSPNSYFLNCFKTADKNLNVKSPREDQTKPPLRLNIPKDTQQPDICSKLILDSPNVSQKDFNVESRSKSLKSSPRNESVSSNVELDGLPKSESEKQFSKFTDDILSSGNNLENIVSNRKVLSNVSDNLKPDSRRIDELPELTDFKNKGELDSKQVLTADVDKKANDFGLISSKVNENKTQKSEVQLKLESEATASENQSTQPRTLYIIIDIPTNKRIDEKSFEVSATELDEESKIKPSALIQSDEATGNAFSDESRASDIPKINVSWQKPESPKHTPLKESSKSLTMLSEEKSEIKNQTGKTSQKMEFEVEEVEDASTYVFQLRFKNNLWKRFSSVGRVPEKEINTRSKAPIESEGLVYLGKSFGGRSKGLGKEITFLEDELEVVKYLDLKNAQIKGRNTNDSVDEDRGKSKSMSSIRNYHNCSSNFSMQKGEGLTHGNCGNIEKYPKDCKTTDLSCQPGQDFQKNSSSSSIWTEQKDFPDSPSTRTVVSQNPSTFTSDTKYSSTDSKPLFGSDGNAKVAAITGDTNYSYENNSNRVPLYKSSDHLESESETSKKILKNKKSGKNKSVESASENKGFATKKFRKNSVKNSFCSGKSGESAAVEDGLGKKNSNLVNFQQSASTVKIGLEKTVEPTFFSPFPPILNEVFKDRASELRGRGRNSSIHLRNANNAFCKTKYKMNSNCSGEKKIDLSENSILFSKREDSTVNCDSLLQKSKDDILNVVKSDSEKDCPKMSDNMVNVANDDLTQNKGDVSLDSLTLMKKVKEIVDFDLQNAVKIFEGREESKEAKEVSSILKTDAKGSNVDNQETEKFTAIEKNNTNNEMKLSPSIEGVGLVKEEKIIKPDITFDYEESNIVNNGMPFTPKFVPAKTEKNRIFTADDNEINSLVVYNSESNNFTVDTRELENAVSRRKKHFDASWEINSIEKMGSLLLDRDCKNNDVPLFIIDETNFNEPPKVCEMKSGDSILVFDEETQTWKVDFSIIEKREKQLREEEELTKRSELILETFENLERGNVTHIPKPHSREKRVFDYNTGNWEVLQPETKSVPELKPSKMKVPFKESDAEEIRKKNSDLYDDLFVAKKEETKMITNEKDAPGMDSSNSKKGDKSIGPNHKKEAKDTSSNESKTTDSSQKQIGERVIDVETPKEPEPPEIRKPIEDNYWETFLKMDILPQSGPKIKMPPPLPSKKIDVPNLQKPSPLKTPPSKTPTSKLPPSTSPPLITPPIITPPLITPPLETPPNPKDKKIELPKLRFPFPFRKDKKIEDSKDKPPTPPTDVKNTEDRKVNTPATPVKNVETPKSKESLPTTGDKNVENPKTKIPAPSTGVKSTIDSPVTPPPSQSKGGQKSGDSKGPTTEDPKSKNPPTLSTTTDQTKSKPPTDGSSKGNAPVKAKPTTTVSGIKAKEDPKSKLSLSSVGDKKEKSLADHYVSDNILEISKNSGKESSSKMKTGKLETVKINITSDTRMPSKITEINLNKKFDEKSTELSVGSKKPNEPKKPSDGTPTKQNEKCSIENKTFYRNFEKYRSTFSDPEYEEKTMKINSDIESNPNLKKLDNWNKTLVLHDIMKPSENIEVWLKDESDKMATLLLKVLQEASEGKAKKKPATTKAKSLGKSPAKGNPYDNIRKKQETATIESVNLGLENEKKLKLFEEVKPCGSKSEVKDIPVQSAQTVEPPRTVEALKFSAKEAAIAKDSEMQAQISLAPKAKLSEDTKETMNSALASRETSTQLRAVSELVEDIPGPEILKKISSVWKFLPAISCQTMIFTLIRIFQLVNFGSSFFNTNPAKSRRYAFSKLFFKYGPIVNLQGPLSGNVILIHKPDHLAKVFEQDASLPVRSVFDSLEQSRQSVEEKVLPVGLPTNWAKSEWDELRKASNDPLMNGCKKLFHSVEFAGETLISNIRRNRNGQNQVSNDFMEEIKRWSLEGLCNVLFEESFGFLEAKTSQINWMLEPNKLYKAVDEATNFLSKCERGFQMWRVMATPASIGLNQAYQSLSVILSKQLHQAELSLKNKNEVLKENGSSNRQDLTFIESMLLNDDMTVEEITCNLVDILLIGTNAMSSAMGFLLYNLAQNVKVQQKLFEEVKEMMPESNSPLDFHQIHSLKYLQACLKESLRLNTPIPILFRVLQNDILLSNYFVPKGTYVVMDSKVSSMKEQLFDEPDKFMPERWLTGEKSSESIYPLALFPFCCGPRADLVKRLMEMQLWSCVAKIVRNYKVEYHFGEIQGTDSVITYPDKPLKLNFSERNI